ncbi:MAG: DNA adenine methylase [Planctomycetia bacterium]|nr:DNA adenine methylase [Planctomycetia bacterium]
MLLFDECTGLDIVASPLNYSGGKYRLLPQILPLFPENISNFVDLFCGGCNVGINAIADHVVFNDSNDVLIGLLTTLQSLPLDDIIFRVEKLIDQYDLSRSSVNGYEYYCCNGSDGLAEYNRISFLKMRDDFNKLTIKNMNYYIRLYVLIIYSFNNQIRFNQAGNFNLPIGKRDFNPQMKSKLSSFCNRLYHGSYRFENQDFRELDVQLLTENDFVYVDPPYLITCATYNEQGGWKENDERNLLFFLDTLHQRKIRFALSNVLRSKGKENGILQEWLTAHQNDYNVHFLNFHYANSNYQTKDKTPSAEEVLIVNY